MPKFTTISPTHITGQKAAAWRRFNEDGYVALGWLSLHNLSDVTQNDLRRLIDEDNPANIREARSCLPKFRFGIGRGDYVAVNNVNHELFGIGLITSEYKYHLGKHDAGNGEDFYSHYRRVKWLITERIRAAEIQFDGESRWEPYGTIGRINLQVPRYIQRLVTGSDEGITDGLQADLIAGADEALSSGGQGFITDSRLRVAIEQYAMGRAKAHYEALGYEVECKGKPYDLLCRKTGAVLYVEVKGTQTAGDVIFLTPNEIEFAESHRGSMELFILSDIQLSGTGASLDVRSGVQRTCAWNIDRTRLKPLGYSYQVSDSFAAEDV